MDGLIVGFPRRNLKAKGIAIFVHVKDGAVYLEFLGIGSDITESSGSISSKGACLVFPVRLRTIDFIQISMGECIDGISSLWQAAEKGPSTALSGPLTISAAWQEVAPYSSRRHSQDFGRPRE